MSSATPTPDAFFFDPLSVALGRRRGIAQGREEGYNDGYDDGVSDTVHEANKRLSAGQANYDLLLAEKNSLKIKIQQQHELILQMHAYLDDSNTRVVALQHHVKKLEEKISAQKKEAIHFAETYAHLQQLDESLSPPLQVSQFLSKEPLPIFDEYKSVNMSLHKLADSKSAPNYPGSLPTNPKELLVQGMVHASLVETNSEQHQSKAGTFAEAPSLSQSERGGAAGEALNKVLPSLGQKELSPPKVSAPQVSEESFAHGQTFVANISKDRRKELKKIGKAVVEKNSAKIRDKTLEKKWWKLGF